MDVSDICYFFSARGGARGSPRRREGEGDFLLKIPGGGGLQEERAEGPGGRLRRIWELGGGGLSIFCGAEMSTRLVYDVL